MRIKVFCLSIIHFHGRFVFQMPEYDNKAENKGIKFKDNLDEDTVYNKCGCDPGSYFELIFRNVKVSQVTYRDGGSVTQGDSIIGQPVLLYGFMPDVSPSAVGAQLFASSMKVGNLLSGRRCAADFRKTGKAETDVHPASKGSGPRLSRCHPRSLPSRLPRAGRHRPS